MESRWDRVRRVLSDGVAPPGLPSSAPGPPGRSPPPAASPLRARLTALGLDRPGERGAPGAEDPPEDGDDTPLEQRVGGRLRDTPHGPVLVTEKRWPLTHRHGDRRLDAALEVPFPLRAHERGERGPPRLDARDAVFFDTETTGLSGGTGTVAFLVGAGRVEGDAFVVRQYCMRDFPEEAALLHALREDVGGAPLVSFNGRSFDWPLLRTRFQLHRITVEPRPHLDLLPLARRLWTDRLPSRTLTALERDVLGFHRQGDLPSWQIPDAWFGYLRTGRAGVVSRAFRHNEIDVVSMLALLGCMAALLTAPEVAALDPAWDAGGTARLLLDLRETERAVQVLEAGIARTPATPDAVALRRMLARLLRRRGEDAKALQEWETVARDAGAFDLEAYEQVAKIQEHRLRAFPEALVWAEAALERAESGSAAEAALQHRIKRLRRRMAR